LKIDPSPSLFDVLVLQDVFRGHGLRSVGLPYGTWAFATSRRAMAPHSSNPDHLRLAICPPHPRPPAAGESERSRISCDNGSIPETSSFWLLSLRMSEIFGPSPNRSPSSPPGSCSCSCPAYPPPPCLRCGFYSCCGWHVSGVWCHHLGAPGTDSAVGV
jgi:hypothetical protein